MAAKVTEPSYSCEICGLSGLSDEELRSHVLNHVSNAASCPFCDLSDVTSEEMLIHVNTTHLDYLTPENELLSFIDDDEDNLSHLSPMLSPTFLASMDGVKSHPRRILTIIIIMMSERVEVALHTAKDLRSVPN